QWASSCSASFVTAFVDFFGNLVAKSVEIAGVAGGNEALVGDDGTVFPEPAGIDDIGLDRGVGRDLAALDDAGFDQQPWRVADCGDDLLVIPEGFYEIER